MQSIRDWMEANPDQAKDIRRLNKSYVFFRITDLSTEDEAVGGEGVQLVPGRSIAVDRALHAYGTPFFIQANLPIANEKAATKFDRLIIAQDTGSAIVGPARADIYFGAGDEAARIAGRIKNAGRLRDAVAARARSGGSRARNAAAAGAPEHVQLQFRTPWKIRRRWSPRGRSRGSRRAAAGAQARDLTRAESKASAEKMSRRRPLSDEEHALWTGFARSITPLRPAKAAGKASVPERRRQRQKTPKPSRAVAAA